MGYMSKSVSIKEFIRAIEALPSDEPHVTPGKWYRTQKEHWLGWLSEYGGPGAYGRKTTTKRDARFAYNHVVNPAMLLWLIEAAGIKPELVSAARENASQGTSMMAQSGAIRKVVPWSEIEKALWGDGVRAHQLR